jgi:hypothetical protein
MIDRHAAVCLKCLFVLMQVNHFGLNARPLIDELTPSLRNFTLDVVLQGAPSFLLVSHRLLGEGLVIGRGMAGSCSTIGMV